MLQDKIQDVVKLLRPYQREALGKMYPLKGVLNFDDMGLGKTITTLTSALQKVSGDNFHMLIVVSQNGLYVWKEQLLDWYGADSTVYEGTPTKRKKIWETFVNSGEHFLITTYGMLKELPKDGWDVLICDEIHQAGLLNHKTQTYQLIEKQYMKFKPFLYLLTGTPIRKGCIDLYAPLHLIDPLRFSNYWGYVNKWCVTIQTPFGKSIERNPSNLNAFRTMLNQYMVRRLKSDVLKDLPGKQRNIIPIMMTPKQRKAHNDVIEELLYSDKDATVITPNKMTAILRARQILVSPRLVGIDDDGGGLNYLKEAGGDLLMANRPIVVFTPFRNALPLISEVILEACPDTHVYSLSGSMTPAAFANSWQGFQNDKYMYKVLLCVIKSGASFHATTSADCFFLGYEWDFNFNAQSEDRLCRLGQDNFVNCNYLFYSEDSVDAAVKEKLNDKQISANFILSNEELYQRMLSKKQKQK